MFEDAAVALSGPLSFIINLSLESCSVPKAWKIAKVIAQHKGGDRDDMTNYRPISILPVISKVMERAVHEQLTKYLEENKILSKTQFVYRKGKSTELATLFLTDEISKEIDNGKMVGALFIDLSKVFDTLNHSILISKIRSCGLMGDTLNWFVDYLSDRSMICEIDSQRSEPRPLTSGMPQGSILGPILFLIYFNDFKKCLQHSKVITFADDTVVYLSRRKHTYIEQDLNRDLQNIAEFFTRNELVINLKPGKAEFMLFSTQKKLRQNGDCIRLQYNHQMIAPTKEYKYLGTIMDQTLSFNTNFHRVYKKTSGKLRLLFSLRSYISPETCVKIYRGILLPVLLYACTTNLRLTNTQLSKLSSLDRRIARLTTKRQTPIQNEMKKHAVLLVRKCLDRQLCENFQNFFSVRAHEQSTRNNGFMLEVPKVKLQVAKFSFRSMGVNIYNNLPIQSRQTDSLLIFKERIKNHFSI